MVVVLNKIESYSSPHPKENCLRCEISISASCFVMCLLDVILKSVCVCGLPNDVHQNFIERFGMGFFYISLSALYSTPLFTTTITTTTTTLYSSFIIYICNKSFTLIVYGRVNIYYLIMLSCVCPIRLGWSILARFITNCGSLFYFIFNFAKYFMFFFFFWAKWGSK